MAHELKVGPWGARYRGRRFACSTGRGGIGPKLAEGDGITPIGRYRLAQVFCRSDRVSLRGATPIGRHWVWSDDPGDPAYNSLRTWPARTLSHERMHRADRLYDLVGVLDYNLDTPRAGAGSAIFLHVWRGPRVPTAGCIAFARRDLSWILARWTAQDRVVIAA